MNDYNNRTERITELAIAVFCLLMAAAVMSAVSAGWIALLFAAASLPVVLVVLFREPFVLLFGAYIFWIPFNNLLKLSSGPVPTLSRFLGISLLVYMAFEGVRARRLVKPDKAVVWWLLFFFVSLSSLLWAEDASFINMGNKVSLVTVYLAGSAYLASRDDMRKLKAVIMYAGIVTAAFLIVSYTYLGISFKDLDRASLVYGEKAFDPNEMAFVLSFSFAICMSYILDATKIYRKFYYMLLLSIMVYGLVLTGSRGGLVGWITMAGVVVYYAPRRLYPAVSVVTVFALIFIFSPEEFFSRVLTVFETGGSGRLGIWENGIEMFTNNYMLGVGMDNFSSVYNRYNNGITSLGMDMVAHNIFLQTAVETGIPGLLLMMTAMVKHYRLAGKIIRRDVTESVWLRACVVGTTVQSLFLGVLWSKFFWLLWTLILLYNKLEDVSAGEHAQTDSDGAAGV